MSGLKALWDAALLAGCKWAACAVFAVILLRVAWCAFAHLRVKFSGVPLLSASLLAVCLFGTSVVGGSKTNEPPRMLTFPHNGTAAVDAEDIARGWRVESVTTNAEPFAAMPSNAVEHARWALRGGRETWFPLGLGAFMFPLGTNRVRRLRVLSGGAVETFRPDGPASICAAGEYASLVPGVSRFSWADSDDGEEKVLRWENVFAGRDRTGGYDAEIRLFADGGFTTRSNDVETVCRRVNPDDWDGDGLANGLDANPTTYDGDFFGVANALPTNANPDAYYWLDLSVTGRLGVATIRVTCDGPSDLGDHVIIARTNEVCHVPLLAGATYAVESDLPFGCSSVSSEYAEIWTNDESHFSVSLPLEFSFERVMMRGGSDSYVAHTSPVDVGPRILDVAGGCCSCATGETGFTWVCSDGCSCGGYWHGLLATAAWGGYVRVFESGVPCPCQLSRKDNPLLWMSLQVPEVVFAGATNYVSELSVVFDPPEATNGVLTLRCVVGGDKLLLRADGGEIATLPCQWNAEMFSGASFTVEGVSVSDVAGDIRLELEYNEPVTGVHSVTQSMTVARVSHETFSEAPSNRERLTLGVGEQVLFYSEPEGLITNAYCSAGVTSNLVEYGEVVFSAMSTGGWSDVSIDCYGALLHYVFSVVEPAGLVVDEVKPFVRDIPNQSGDFVLLFFNRIVPTDVSFYAVETLEIPMVATNAIGYYAQPSMSDSLDHGKRGAGRWCGMGDDNSYGDYVSVSENPPPWLDGGSFTWPIPFAWRHQKDTSATNVFCRFEQRFELDCDGTSRVKKFGYCGERTTNNVFRLTMED